MTNEKESLHARVTQLLESTHCPKHGMEWEACCFAEVVLELHNKTTDLLTTTRKEEREAAFKEAVVLAQAVRSSSLWNASGYDGALTSLINNLRVAASAEAEHTDDLYARLKRLTDSYTAPCADRCEHSQCPLLRELLTIQVGEALNRARIAVRPVVDRERKGEQIGDLMNMQLD